MPRWKNDGKPKKKQPAPSIPASSPDWQPFPPSYENGGLRRGSHDQPAATPPPRSFIAMTGLGLLPLADSIARQAVRDEISLREATRKLGELRQEYQGGHPQPTPTTLWAENVIAARLADARAGRPGAMQKLADAIDAEYNSQPAENAENAANASGVKTAGAQADPVIPKLWSLWQRAAGTQRYYVTGITDSAVAMQRQDGGPGLSVMVPLESIRRGNWVPVSDEAGAAIPFPPRTRVTTPSGKVGIILLPQRERKVPHDQRIVRHDDGTGRVYWVNELRLLETLPPVEMPTPALLSRWADPQVRSTVWEVTRVGVGADGNGFVLRDIDGRNPARTFSRAAFEAHFHVKLLPAPSVLKPGEVRVTLELDGKRYGYTYPLKRSMESGGHFAEAIAQAVANSVRMVVQPNYTEAPVLVEETD